MAFVAKKTETLQHPSEPGVTVTVRTPLSAGDMALLETGMTGGSFTLRAVHRAIVEWSYDEPVTLENVEALDVTTFGWLSGYVMGNSGIRDDAEKNASSASSSPSTGQVALTPVS
jgi:hypothetical protein